MMSSRLELAPNPQSAASEGLSYYVSYLHFDLCLS
jgi:hypothetical protein